MNSSLRMIKKIFSFSNKRQIWRILLSGTNKLIVEERDTDSKQVYFNCLQAETGEILFSNYQFDEKFWIGIETIYKDIIYFHKFTKPDMPGHKEIIAFDIAEKKILWQTEDYIYLFIKDGKVYVYKQKFEHRVFFILDYKSGELIDEIGTDAQYINQLRENLFDEDVYKNYYFPVMISREQLIQFPIVEKIIGNSEMEGNIECISFNNLLLFNFYKKTSNYLENIFYIVNTFDEKIILKEVLNTRAKAFVPDSFFIKDNLLFLLKEKKIIDIYSVNV